MSAVQKGLGKVRAQPWLRAVMRAEGNYLEAAEGIRRFYSNTEVKLSKWFSLS